MRSTIALCLAGASAALALNVPVKRQSQQSNPDHPTINDTDVLNFALTLEHLENAFYTTGLQNFSQNDFNNAGLPAPAFGFYEQVSQHEQTHVDNLTTILGSAAVQPCTYNFGVNGNLSNFVAMSDLFETVGASAYTGASVFIQNKQLLSIAGSILATEARQSAWINNAVRGANPWNTAYETALDLNQAFTLASGVIVSCPQNNTPIPVQVNPPLTVVPPTPLPGQNITVSFTANTTQGGNGTNSTLFAAFLSGITPTFVPLQGQSPFNVTVPQTDIGAVFLAITNSSSEHGDNVTVAGPAFLNFPFNSNGTQTNFTH